MKLFLGMILGVVLVAASVFGYFLSGSAPRRRTLHRCRWKNTWPRKLCTRCWIGRCRRPCLSPPTRLTNLAGAQIYKENCAVCHGLPGQPATAIARGMFPKPPALMQGKGVTDDEPGETYWKVVHGIRHGNARV